MGALLAYAGFVPRQQLLVAQGNGAARTGHLTLVSPAVLLKNAFGFTLAEGSIRPQRRGPGSVWSPLSWLRSAGRWDVSTDEGVETWEASPSQRWMIALGIIATIVLPVAMADTNYDKPAPTQPTRRRYRGFSLARKKSRFYMARWSTAAEVLQHYR